MTDADVCGGRVQLGRLLPLQGQRHREQPSHRGVQPVKHAKGGQAQPRAQGRQSRRIGDQRMQQHCRHHRSGGPGTDAI